MAGLILLIGAALALMICAIAFINAADENKKMKEARALTLAEEASFELSVSNLEAVGGILNAQFASDESK